jgi:hypothetical protein
MVASHGLRLASDRRRLRSALLRALSLAAARAAAGSAPVSVGVSWSTALITF